MIILQGQTFVSALPRTPLILSLSKDTQASVPLVAGRLRMGMTTSHPVIPDSIRNPANPPKHP